MDTRKLVIGLAVVLAVIGLILALATPGGLLNRQDTATVDFGFGALSVTGQKSSPWPIVGYVLLGVGVIGTVVGIAMKPPPKL
jgi:hypothetical protein